MKVLSEAKQEKLPVDFLTQFISQGWNEVGNLKASKIGINKTFKDTKKVEDILQDLIDAYLIAIGRMELLVDKKDYLDLPDDKELKESLTKVKYKVDESLIESNEEIKNEYNKFINHLIFDLKINFHPEDDFESYVDQDGNPTFTKKEASKLNKKMEYFYSKLTDNEIYEPIFAAFKKLGIIDESLIESNEEKAEPIEAKKFEGKNKTEIFTELPDYDVEVEQKGDKIEIELEPKDAEAEEDEIMSVSKTNAKKPTFEEADWFVDFDEPDMSEPKLSDEDLYGKQN